MSILLLLLLKTLKLVISKWDHKTDVPVTMTENVPHCKENIYW